MDITNEKPATKPARKRTTTVKKPKAPKAEGVVGAPVTGNPDVVAPGLAGPRDVLAEAKTVQATILHGLAAAALPADKELAVAYNVLVSVLFKHVPAEGRGKWRHKACKELNERLVKALVA